MKSLAALIFCSVAVTLCSAALDENLRTQLIYNVLCHRIETIAAQKVEGVVFFVEAGTEIEEKILKKYRFIWLKPAADLLKDANGNYKLKGDKTTHGCGLNVTQFELVGEEWRCVLGQYYGPLGGEGFHYRLKKVNGEWIVIEAKFDNSAMS
jgi:hypothetical protein